MNFKQLEQEAKQAFDMRRAPSLTTLMQQFSDLADARDQAAFAHALRCGSMLNGLEFVKNVIQKTAPWIPAFAVDLVHKKAETYILLQLQNYPVNKNTPIENTTKGGGE